MDGFIGLAFLINAHGELLQAPSIAPFATKIECESAIAEANADLDKMRIQIDANPVTRGAHIVGVCVDGKEIH